MQPEFQSAAKILYELLGLRHQSGEQNLFNTRCRVSRYLGEESTVTYAVSAGCLCHRHKPRSTILYPTVHPDAHETCFEMLDPVYGNPIGLRFNCIQHFAYSFECQTRLKGVLPTASEILAFLLKGLSQFLTSAATAVTKIIRNVRGGAGGPLIPVDSIPGTIFGK